MMKEEEYFKKRNLVRQKKCITGLDDEGGLCYYSIRCTFAG